MGSCNTGLVTADDVLKVCPRFQRERVSGWLTEAHSGMTWQALDLHVPRVYTVPYEKHVDMLPSDASMTAERVLQVFIAMGCQPGPQTPQSRISTYT